MRIAEIIAVAALAGSLAACGSSSSKPTAAAATSTSTNQAAPVSSATTAPGNAATSTTAANAATTSPSAPPSAPPTTQPSARSSSTASNPGGVANAGDHVTIVGTLQYLAPGKFLVHPDDGSTDQGFYVSDATRILGAAAICGGPDGNVTIGGDGYGTTKCTEDQLETAAKTASVKVRVTMNRKTGDVASVEEKYHP
ncbi:hypothetical protein [Catenulispora sp. EB89]|uniref:hypothetical protein n=1 Tax=Catenulispora sp. EB89 TaxID=3156257 RepID=UPI003517AF60